MPGSLREPFSEFLLFFPVATTLCLVNHDWSHRGSFPVLGGSRLLPSVSINPESMMASFIFPRCRGLILLSPVFARLDLCLCSGNVNITFSTLKAEQFEFLTCLQLLLK